MGIAIVCGDTIKAAEDNQVPELTIANVKKVLKEENFPEIVLRQAITETGWFKCTNCSSRNNIFGFYYKKKYLFLTTG